MAGTRRVLRMTVGRGGSLVGAMKRLLFVLWCAVVSPVGAGIMVSEWKALFQGVELAEGATDKAEPRLQKVFVVRVDLRAPGIGFLSTPANGERPLETTSETTAEFLTRQGVQVAINANFFAPCCSPGDKNLSGLAVSLGEVVSPPEPSGVNSQVLVITRDNRARIADASNAKTFSTERIWTAVAGSDRLLADGSKPTNWVESRAKAVHPRTAVGVSNDGRYLVILVIDGRQKAYSEGANFAELADWLLRFGAHDAINLDGGGSTTMVRAEGGRAVVVNRPSGVALGSVVFGAKADEPRVLRSNGNNFGVLARPLLRGGK